MKAGWRVWAGLLVVWVFFGSSPAQAQKKHWSDEAWTPIIEQGGVAFSYIFYSKADNYHNGVVVKLVNTNGHAVRYRFTIIFRAGDGSEHVEHVQGNLDAKQMKTGESDGLFWIPFADERSIGEIGLRGVHIDPGQKTP